MIEMVYFFLGYALGYLTILLMALAYYYGWKIGRGNKK